MFGIEAMNIVIGLIFIYLLFSLFVSIINEIIGNLFNARGNTLFESIKELIGEEGIQEIKKDPRIKILTKRGSVISSAKSELEDLKNTHWPDHIPESLFADVIADLDNTKLGGIVGEFHVDVKNSTTKMKEVYETALLKTRQTYIQYARKLTIVVSIIVVIAFNVDSIAIFKDLANDPAKAAIVADMAEQYIAVNDTVTADLIQQSVSELKLDLAELHESQIEELNSPLGFGWNADETIGSQLSILGFIGWFITVLALSLGAPFWFDLLKKVVNIKQELKNSKP